MKIKRKILYFCSLLLISVVVAVGCSRADKEQDVVVLNYTGEDLKSIGFTLLDENGEITSSGGVVNADNSPIKKGTKNYLNLESDRFILSAEDLNGNKVDSIELRKSDITTYAKVIKNEADNIQIIVSTEMIDLEAVEKFIGFDIPEEVSGARLVDSHGGFHGDGVTAFEAVILDKDRDNFEKKASKWKEISDMSSVLDGFIYSDGQIAGDDFLNEFGIVKPERGYYKFFDEQGKSRNEDAAFRRASLNFNLAVYDCDKGIMTYVRFDT